MFLKSVYIDCSCHLNIQLFLKLRHMGQCHEIYCLRFFHESTSPNGGKFDTGGKFCHQYRWYCCTGGKFAASVNDTVGNLPLVSMTQAAINRNNIRLLTP
jgi:hypothetical protein